MEIGQHSLKMVGPTLTNNTAILKPIQFNSQMKNSFLKNQIRPKLKLNLEKKD